MYIVCTSAIKIHCSVFTLLFLALPPNCEFVVNFSPELSEIISETKYLEKLDFPVPDLARNVALQEEKFLAYCNGLNRCLARYHTLLGSLKEAEVLHICKCSVYTLALK